MIKSIVKFVFMAVAGNDEIGQYLISALKKTPVVLKDFKLIDNRTPSTVVLSDPSYDNGHGERMFINSIGAAWDYGLMNWMMIFLIQILLFSEEQHWFRRFMII